MTLRGMALKHEGRWRRYSQVDTDLARLPRAQSSRKDDLSADWDGLFLYIANTNLDLRGIPLKIVSHRF